MPEQLARLEADMRTALLNDTLTLQAIPHDFENILDTYGVSGHPAVDRLSVVPPSLFSEIPFWRGMEQLFGLAPSQVIPTMWRVAEHLQKQGKLSLPTPLSNLPRRSFPYTAYQLPPGEAIEPHSATYDRCTQDSEWLYQLGEHVGAVHRQAYRHFGLLEGYSDELTHYPARLVDTLKVLGNFPAAKRDAQVQQLLPHYLERAAELHLSDPCALIMMNAWPSQFSLSGHRLTGVTDVSAYVVGPPALEFTLIELWAGDLSAFKQGYYSVRSTWSNDLESHRELYRFFLFLLYGCPPAGLEACLYSSGMFPQGDRLKGRRLAPRLKLRPSGYPGLY